MRRAVILLSLCASVASAATAHHSRIFNGVTASFVLLNPSLRVTRPLKVDFTLRNESSRLIDFRYGANLLEHIEVFTSRGHTVDIKRNSPIFESIAASISLKPGESFHRIEKIDLSVWYDLAPGDYYLIFKYDLRLLPRDVMNTYGKKLHSQDWVVWDAKKYPFHIHQ